MNSIKCPALKNDLKCILAMNKPRVTANRRGAVKQKPVPFFCVNDKCYTYATEEARDKDMAAIRNLLRIHKKANIQLPGSDHG